MDRVNKQRECRRVLLISNGHGEDLLAGVLAQALDERSEDLEIWAFPVVGSGQAYQRFPVQVVGVQKEMPSGGWVRQSLGALREDIKAGFLELTVQQWRAFKALHPQVTYTVAVGDIYALYLGFRFCPKPLVFVPTAKSDYIRGHLAIEKSLMKKHCELVLPRDEVTAANLCLDGVPARYVGNLMMDAIPSSGQGFPALSNRVMIGILPGSREEAYVNLPLLSISMEVIARDHPDTAYAVAMAGNLSLDRAVNILASEGWQMASEHDPSPQSEPVESLSQRERLLIKDGAYLLLAQGRFGDILENSRVLIGLAGTANEQAAGLGKPVVAFPGPGAQYTDKFMAMQKRLLGDALEPTSGPEAAGRAVLDILADPDKYASMAACGQERMGEPGGAGRMAELLLHLWNGKPF
mgnify:FL=1